jgi:DNA polymerase-3 subunit beta
VKFQVSCGNLLAAIQKVNTTVDGKNFDLGTNGILFDVYKGETTSGIYLYTTDMSGETVVKVEGTVEENGQAVLDPIHLQAPLLHRNPDEVVSLSLVKSKVDGKPSQIKIKVGKNICHIGYSQKGVETLINRMKIIPFKTEANCVVDGKIITSAVKKISFCTAGDEEQTKVLLNGAELKINESEIKFIATNGQVGVRYCVKIENGKNFSIIIPSRSFSALNKLINKDRPVSLISKGNKFYVKPGNNVYYGTNILAGKFPAIETVLDNSKNYQWVSVNREEFKQSLDRVSVFDAKRKLHLEFLSNSLKINVIGHEGSSVSISDEIDLEREEGVDENIDFSSTLNIDYVSNILSVMGEKKIRIGVKDFTDVKSSMSPVMFSEESSDGKSSTLYCLVSVRTA